MLYARSRLIAMAASDLRHASDEFLIRTNLLEPRTTSWYRIGVM